MYLSAQKSMTIRFYIHSVMKRAEAVALLDSGVTENFLNLSYAKWLKLSIKQLLMPHTLLNVDGTENKSGKLQYYTDLDVQTGSTKTTLQFFLSDLGEHKILGYPWFTTMQPHIDWRRGWIDHTQLSIILQVPNAQKAIFVPQTQNVPQPLHPKDCYFMAKVTIGSLSSLSDANLSKVPKEFHCHAKVFSEHESQRLLEHMVWDHAIKLLLGAPALLPGKLLHPPQNEIQEIYIKLWQNTYKGEPYTQGRDHMPQMSSLSKRRMENSTQYKITIPLINGQRKTTTYLH